MKSNRRTYLGAVGGTVVTALAGCMGGSSSSSGGGLPDHPSARDIEDEPRLGPKPSEAEATMVVFDGPACTECSVYDKKTFPKIKSNLIDTGKVAYYGRLSPEYPWGKTASSALEAATARKTDAYWTLLFFYLSNQDQFDEKNVLPKTKQHLKANTDLDAAAIVEDAKADKYWDEVKADKQAWKDAGGSKRPMFFLFRDGEFVTEIAGPQGYSTIESALGI